MNTNILYVSYDGITDQLGQSQVIPYLTGLSKKGYNIFILSAEKRTNYFSAKEKISKLLQDNNISWHHIFYTKTPPVISTLWDILKLRRKSIMLHNQYKFKVVHCRSYIPAFIGLIDSCAPWIKSWICDKRGRNEHKNEQYHYH